MERNLYAVSGSNAAIAVTEDGRLCEYLPGAGWNTSLAETIFKGRVERVVPGMRAAFVQLGLEKNGFLPLKENSHTVDWPKLQSGQEVLVQVKKDPAGQKGAFLTRDITLAGQYVLLMPQNRYIGVSARVMDENQRETLTALGREISAGRYGLVMRAAAVEADVTDVAEEAHALCERWEAIVKRMPTSHAPSVLERPRTALERLLDDYLPRGNTRLITNDQALAASLKDRLPVTCMPELDLETIPGLQKQLDEALQRRVWLRSGANLFIDPCEAMTVIDVNSAKFTGKHGLEDTLLQLNLEAAKEIARQVRLRNLAGIILIDFVDMTSEEHRWQVQQALEQALAADRVKTVVHGFTSLGLMEMTRKKTSLPLREQLTAPCPHCHGTGRVERKNTDA